MWPPLPAGRSGAVLGEDRVEHVDDEPPLGLGQAGDGVQLLLQARDGAAAGAALGRGRRGLAVDQRLDRDVEGASQAGQEGDRGTRRRPTS